MSFLDNLENNLKALEGREEGGLDEARKRNSRAGEARTVAPWAARLRSSAWANEMMRQATMAGHKRRLRIGLFWIGASLRLEALNQRLDIQPTGTGIEAVFLEGPVLKSRMKVDLDGNPGPLLEKWLKVVDEQRKRDQAETSRRLAEIADEE